MPAEQKEREREERSGRELIDAAASDEKLTDAERGDALAWFLSDEGDDDVVTHTLELNVGGPAHPDGSPLDSARPPRWIKWTIQPVDEALIRRILRSAAPNANRRARRSAGDDGADANLRIIVAGTISPNLVEAAQQKNIADPAIALRLKFKKKPGLIGQIADAIMELSGFNDEDVRDAREVVAAGG